MQTLLQNRVFLHTFFTLTATCKKKEGSPPYFGPISVRSWSIKICIVHIWTIMDYLTNILVHKSSIFNYFSPYLVKIVLYHKCKRLFSWVGVCTYVGQLYIKLYNTLPTYILAYLCLDCEI